MSGSKGTITRIACIEKRSQASWTCKTFVSETRKREPRTMGPRTQDPRILCVLSSRVTNSPNATLRCYSLPNSTYTETNVAPPYAYALNSLNVLNIQHLTSLIPRFQHHLTSASTLPTFPSISPIPRAENQLHSAPISTQRCQLHSTPFILIPSQV